MYNVHRFCKDWKDLTRKPVNLRLRTVSKGNKYSRRPKPLSLKKTIHSPLMGDAERMASNCNLVELPETYSKELMGNNCKDMTE